MRREELLDEARKCRTWARRFTGRPEQSFLLNAAALFDDLAREGGRSVPRVRNESEADISRRATTDHSNLLTHPLMSRVTVLTRVPE
jgi:hypothetical protein